VSHAALFFVTTFLAQAAGGARTRGGARMSRLRAFGRSGVGDDPRLAVGIALALGLTWLLEHEDVSAWWLVPVAVPLPLADSRRRESRRG
jgi:hypothetical protein